MRHDDDSDSDDEDWELPDEEEEGYGDDDGETPTIDCPACGATVYEDAEQCPVCGEYITQSTSAWDGKPLWWIILGLLGIFAVLSVFILG